MKIYIAALFSRREEMEANAKELIAHGHEVTARWVFGGESGKTRTDVALLDFEDIRKADVVLSFTNPYGTATTGGGRHVEFGYAIAHGKIMHIVGERENVFHHYPDVVTFTNLTEWIRSNEILKD